jgi:voltage-gated potassium channel
MLKFISMLFRQTLFRVALGIALFAFSGAVLITFFENKLNNQFQVLGDAIWYVFVTMTTVGYGDKVPVTTGGKVVGVMVMLFGMTLLSVFTATISSIFVARKLKEVRGLEEIKLRDHLIICGWSHPGEQILTFFQKDKEKAGPIVLINQLNEDTINDILNHFADLKIKFVRGDYTKEIILNRANIRQARAVLILPDQSSGLSEASDERTILATLSIKTINQKIKVYAHLLDRENLPHLKKAKVDDVLISDSYSGYLMAAHVLAPGVPQTIELLFSENAPFLFQRLDIPDDFIDRTYGELKQEVENNKETICIGLGREQERVQISAILSDDYSSLDQFIKRKFEEAGRAIGEEKKTNIRINPSVNTILTAKDFLIVITRGEKTSDRG